MTTFLGKQAFQTIRVIHFALMGGLTLFSFVVIFLNTSGTELGQMDSTVLLAIAGAMTFMAIFLGPILYKQQLSKLSGNESLQQKMTIFQTAHIVRCALIEAGGLFGAVICIVSGSLYGLAFTAVSIGMFILKMPNPYMLEQDLKLTSEEKRALTVG